MEQVPGASSVAVEPDTVQTEAVVDAKLTGNPELAVAVKVMEETAGWLAIAAKVIVWLVGVAGPEDPHPAMQNMQRLMARARVIGMLITSIILGFGV